MANVPPPMLFATRLQEVTVKTTDHMKQEHKPYEGRETEEWWWGGKSHPTQRIIERNEDDERLDCPEYDRVKRIRKN